MNHPITVADSGISFECPPESTILEAAEEAGWTIPYSCRKGVCSTCLGRVEHGEVAVRRQGTVRGPADDVLLCQAVPRCAVEIRPSRIVAGGPPPRRKLSTKVYRVSRPASRVVLVELRFPIGRRAPFSAGQFLNVYLPDGDTRPYSMANAPRDNDMAELHVRVEPGGKFSERVAAALMPGDLVTVEVPFGETTLPQDAEPLVLLATGTGFAPVKSIVLDQIARRGTRPMQLYWGGRTEEDLYLLKTARRWAQQLAWFSVTPVVSRPAIGWSGRTGWVQDVALADHPDLSGHVVYACGSEAMVTTARNTLTAKAGLRDDRFHADAFVPIAGRLAFAGTGIVAEGAADGE